MEQKKQEGSGFFRGFISGILLTCVLLVAGFLVGNVVLSREKIQGSTQGNAVIVEPSSIVDAKFLKKIEAIQNLIYDRYYLSETSAEELREGAYEGVVASLGDIYSVYYTPEEAKEIFAQSEGIYYGIGAYVQMDTVTGYAKITGTIPNTPAEEAGLRANDILYMVNGEDLVGLDLTQVVTRIKGEEGTLVHLTLVRDGEYIEVDVERRQVEEPTVQYEMLDDNMGYVQLSEFNDVSVSQFAEALTSIQESGAEGMILDLRGNPGGNLNTVVEIADMLLDEGLILYTEDKAGNREEFLSEPGMLWDKPIVVLVDGNSASASEVLSGALKDHGRATLVGTTTFGKGIVQSIVTMTDGSAVKLTVSAYYTPAGVNIHGTGIEPDVEVKFDAEAYYGEEAFDNQLDRAKEVLRDFIS